MKILLVADFLRAEPWRHEPLAPRLADALAARGHEVTLACPSAHDPDDCSIAHLLMHRPGASRTQTRPLAFLRWLQTLRDAYDATLSLTHAAPGDVWLPLGPPPAEVLRWIARPPNVARTATELITNAYLFPALLARRHALRTAPGPRLGLARPPAPFRSVGYVSALNPPEPSRLRALRDRTRSALRLAPDDHLLLCPCTHPARPGTHAMLAALGDAPRTIRPLFVGRCPWRAHHLARWAGLADRAIVLGPTRRMAALLAAADAVAAPGAARSPWAAGRFIADALRFARPVLAHPDAPGAELLTPATGRVVSDPRDWPDALRHLPTRSPHAHATDHATPLSLDALAARIEPLLA